jgi:hypothetical protein
MSMTLLVLPEQKKKQGYGPTFPSVGNGENQAIYPTLHTGHSFFLLMGSSRQWQRSPS